MSKSHGLFDRVAGGLHPRRSVFDLSYRKRFDADFGLLYPVMCDELVPGDTFKIGNRMTIRIANPLLAPISDSWNAYVHYFFVPYRLLDKNFEQFITGGVNGDSTVDIHRLHLNDITRGDSSGSMFDLVDYLGFPLVNNYTPDEYSLNVLSYPFDAYASVWNYYYRDETLMKPVTCAGVGYYTNSVPLNRNLIDSGIDEYDFQYISASDMGNRKGLLYRSWKKDYFTSALPFQQRGQSPRLPVNISGIAPVYTNFDNISTGLIGTYGLRGHPDSSFYLTPAAIPDRPEDRYMKELFTVDGSEFRANSFDIADLRLAFQIQKWLERNARGGVRYTEFLGMHFGVSPKDERLQRPEYIGGSKQPILISEVLQTSASENQPTPQGNLAGHGLSIGGAMCCDYTASEFGLIIGLLSIMPEANYQQGINRQWTRETKFDFFFPEFVGLSEQPVLNKEIFCSNESWSFNDKIFGYQGRYDEMRFKPNLTCGRLRSGKSLDYWTLTRNFNTIPTLSPEFLKCKPDKQGIFAVADENPFVVDFANIIKAIRPIPALAEPGLIDHF